MKVIIVEVTRAANTFGRTHLAKIREAYAADRGDRLERAQADGQLPARVTPEFAALAFYGSIEQVLTGWIFDARRRRRGRARAGQDDDRRDDLPRASSGTRPALRPPAIQRSAVAVSAAPEGDAPRCLIESPR